MYLSKISSFKFGACEIQTCNSGWRFCKTLAASIKRSPKSLSSNGLEPGKTDTKGLDMSNSCCLKNSSLSALGGNCLTRGCPQ